MASIKINNLKLSTIIGTKETERKTPQKIRIDISFDYDSGRAEGSDNLKDAVNYQAISDDISRRVKTSKFFLLEKLADEVCSILMSDKRIKLASVTVTKFKALRNADSVSATVTRARKQPASLRNFKKAP
ncbi:MAG: dihydroneopterin aldolase [Candidatus Omnitrophica bacterium]|nr:dihydroneopterin aldolase [Candidatus Omnitrophota bacterium]